MASSTAISRKALACWGSVSGSEASHCSQWKRSGPTASTRSRALRMAVPLHKIFRNVLDPPERHGEKSKVRQATNRKRHFRSKLVPPMTRLIKQSRHDRVTSAASGSCLPHAF